MKTRSLRLIFFSQSLTGMGGFGVALDALGGKCVFMSELEGNFSSCEQVERCRHIHDTFLLTNMNRLFLIYFELQTTYGIYIIIISSLFRMVFRRRKRTRANLMTPRFQSTVTSIKFQKVHFLLLLL